MKKFLLLALILCILILPMNIGAVNIRFLDISIGNYNIGTEIKISGKSGLGIYDRKERFLYKDLENTNVKLLVKEKELGEIFDLSNEYIASIDLKNGIIGSIEGDPIYVNGRGYRGLLGFSYVKSGKLLSHLPIEYYLKGVVPREMGASFPEEALKAQTIASRSYALAGLNRHSSEGFNLCNTTHCQVYGGLDAENQRVNDIIDKTKGLCIRYNGNIGEGIFSSSNGGYMESGKGAWGGSNTPYLVAKEDPFSKNTVNSNWEIRLSREKLEGMLRSAGVDVGRLDDLEILTRTEGKRVQSIVMKGSNGEKTITGDKLRLAIGGASVKSNYFYIDREGTKSGQDKKTKDLYSISDRNLDELRIEDIFVVDEKEEPRSVSLDNYKFETANGIRTVDIKDRETLNEGDFIIRGHGFGHGVGMSQYGAKVMAEEGYDFIDILLHYYDGIEIY